jgi:hypothetical protein
MDFPLKHSDQTELTLDKMNTPRLPVLMRGPISEFVRVGSYIIFVASTSLVVQTKNPIPYAD